VCLLDFRITRILTSMTVIIECISWLIKVTDSNDARWKPETHWFVCIYTHTHTHTYIYIYIYIQGVPGGMCQTSGECSLS
jgi:hypothetical protein